MHLLFDVTDNSSTPQIFRKSSYPQNSALQQKVVGANFLCSLLKGTAQGAQNKMLTKIILVYLCFQHFNSKTEIETKGTVQYVARRKAIRRKFY